MKTIRIRRRKRRRDAGRCANLECGVILEPPYNILTFSLDCEPKHVFCRSFCVDCIDWIMKNGYDNVTFSLQGRGYEAK
jgi:hypothetical protein